MRSFVFKWAVAVLAVIAAADRSHAVVFFDSTSFKASIDSDYFLEPFDFATYGGFVQSTYNSPVVNGYSYTMSIDGGGSLYTVDGAMSTFTSGDVIRVDFTGKPVTAVGGLFYGSDIDGNFLASLVTINLSDGTNHVFNSTSATDFRGFTTSAPIVSMTVSTPNSNWPAIDDFLVGTNVPEPATATLGLLGMAGMMIRRRRMA